MRIGRYSHQGEVGFGVHEDETVAAISPHPFGAFEYTGQRLPTAEVRLLEPWTLYARIGDAFAYACAVLTVLALAASWRAQPYRVSRV